MSACESGVLARSTAKCSRYWGIGFRKAHEIDSLAKRVAIHWGFWRGDAKTLRQDAAVVGDSRAVPEETAVADFHFGER